jgi:metal-responsive CopG/Arc/MetJ family transcriptional regulator
MALLNIFSNMKTIAVTIDEMTLERLDRIMAGDRGLWRSRSEAIREAVQELVVRIERQSEEEREREIFRRHRGLINRQAAALVKEQAKL